MLVNYHMGAYPQGQSKPAWTTSGSHYDEVYSAAHVLSFESKGVKVMSLHQASVQHPEMSN